MLKKIIATTERFLRSRGTRHHVAVFVGFCLVLLAEVAFFSVCFHLIMRYEGRDFSLITGAYWTLTVMSTLGFGDVTFHSDIGKFFSIIVLLSGIVFFLILLPYTFLQHFYNPWLERQKSGMVPRKLPPGTSGHVLIVGTGPIALNLAKSIDRLGMDAYLLCGDMQTAQQLIGRGYKAVLGEYDDKETYSNLSAQTAASMVVLESDIKSANIVFSAREAAPNLSIVTGVENMEARDILRMAGCSRCFHFYSLLGEALARRVSTPSRRVSILGHFGRLAVAEAPVMRTPLAGKTLLQSGIRQDAGVSVVGVWERGVFSLPRPDMTFGRSTVLMVAGTEEQVQAFNAMLSSADGEAGDQSPTIIIGGGRVGLAVARSLARRGIKAVVVDRKADIRTDGTPLVCGDASNISLLEKAGIRTTPSVIVTTHEDDANIYLTIYCRKLRPDVQIISRASLDRNVNGLHLAGADLVLSLASLVSSTVVNLLTPDRLLMLNERLAVFRYTIKGSLAGKTLMSSGIRNRTRCSVLAVHSPDGSSYINPVATHELKMGDTMYLIGDTAAQALFRHAYGQDTGPEKKDPQWTAGERAPAPEKEA